MTQSLPRSLPEAQGVQSSSIEAFVNAANEKFGGLHSFILLRHGHVVAEGWWSPYGPDDPHMLFSLSKSFTSTAIGLAVAEGRLSVDDAVISFFPEDAPADPEANLKAMKVRHLLSMSTGNGTDTTGSLRQGEGDNWTKAFLAQPVEHEPGTFFVYNSGATYMLSAILQRITGMTLLEYLQPRLFAPLGIENPTWQSCPKGINTGGWGLKIKTEDIANFGQLYLNKGKWNGEQLLPKAWVEEASSKHISNGDDPNSDWAQGYGYQFWRSRNGAYRGDGAFGQYCVIVPEQDTVVAITSGVGDMQAALNLVWDHLLPAMKPAALPVDITSSLPAQLQELQLAPVQGSPSSSTAEKVSGLKYEFDENDRNIESVTLDLKPNECLLTLRNGKGDHTLTASYGEWKKGTTTLDDTEGKLSAAKVDEPVAASYAWIDADTLQLVHWLYETPFKVTLTFHFSGEEVRYHRAVNVNFGPSERPELVGRLAPSPVASGR